MQTSNPSSQPFEAPDVIHFYGRAQMLAHGELLDVSTMARQAGFVVRVAMTREAWAECVEWRRPSSQAKCMSQSEAGRLWDLLWMARSQALRRRGTQFRFAMRRVPQHGDDILARHVVLLMRTHAGDQGEQVVTIMLPWQD